MVERVLRMRRRYMFLTPYPRGGADEVWARIREVFMELYGTIGLAESGLRRVRTVEALVLVCYHDWVARIVAALTLINDVAGRPISLDICRISGTMRGVLRKR
ncbi:MAG: Rpp14/Pop5 family protein [Nitrososphaerota archaeon]